MTAYATAADGRPWPTLPDPDGEPDPDSWVVVVGGACAQLPASVPATALRPQERR